MRYTATFTPRQFDLIEDQKRHYVDARGLYQMMEDGVEVELVGNDHHDQTTILISRLNFYKLVNHETPIKLLWPEVGYYEACPDLEIEAIIVPTGAAKLAHVFDRVNGIVRVY